MLNLSFLLCFCFLFYAIFFGTISLNVVKTYLFTLLKTRQTGQILQIIRRKHYAFSNKLLSGASRSINIKHKIKILTQNILKGQKPICPLKTTLSVVSLLNPVLALPCDIAVCLLDSTCEDECPSALISAVSTLTIALLQTASCDEGLNLCPAKNILHVEQCLAGGKGEL